LVCEEELMHRQERGIVLGATLIMAFVAALASYGMLAIAIAQSHHARFYRERSPALGAAEAGVVWAQQNLLADPTWPAPLGNPTTVNVDIDVDGIDDVTIAVTPACAAAPCPSRRIDATVIYND
jgi:Tfp pilus assembly protein PilX